MKRLIPYLALSTMMALSLSAWGASGSDPALRASTMEETQTRVDPNTTLRQITYVGSDSLSIDDPLGNSPVTPRHDAGPPLTRHLSYGPECRDEACVRAEQRWMSPTTWRQDRAMGRSLGWGSSTNPE